jgi:hypothetical protein
MAAATVFSGTVAANGNTTVTYALPAKYSALAVSVQSAYSATAATTGVKLEVGYSIDGGVTFSDLALVATTVPTVSSGSPVSSQQFAELNLGATHLQFKLINQDGTNIATVTLEARAAVL